MLRRLLLLIPSLSLTLLPTAALPPLTQAQVIKSGLPACPAIALTFDLCPVRKGTGYDKALVDYLIERKIPATFFMSGRWIAKHDPEVEQLLEMGFFEVGTHGEVHTHLIMQNADEQREEILGPVKILSEHYAHEAVFPWDYGLFNGALNQVIRIRHSRQTKSCPALRNASNLAASLSCMLTGRENRLAKLYNGSRLRYSLVKD